MERYQRMKHGLLCVCMIVLSIGLTGCYQRSVTARVSSGGDINGDGTAADNIDIDGVNTDSPGRDTDEDKMESFADADSIKRCVDAAYRDEDLIDGIIYCPLLIGDTLYYWNGVSVGHLLGNAHIYRKEGEKSQAVEIAALRDKILLFYTVDQEQNLYYLYLEYSEDGNRLFLQKQSSYGDTIYNVRVAPEAETEILEGFDRKGYTYQHGTVSSDGMLVMGSIEGKFYLFDKKGEFLCSGMDGWIRTENFKDRGLLNAGDNGIFAYEISGRQLLLAEINTENAGRGSGIQVTVDTNDSLSVFSGYEKGIFISDGNSMWEYDPASEDLTVLFHWGDPDFKMRGCSIYDIGLLEDGRLYIVANYKGNTKHIYFEMK